MNDIEFNLLDQPWVRVMKDDVTVEEVSLKEAIVNAHKYKGLSGELPTQDIAVMRLMLAVLHTVFSRVDENGNDSLLDGREKNALNRWEALWRKGSFSEKAVTEYFDKWYERFWLFHPQRPFGQVAGLNTKGTKGVYTAAKLNGEISESNNKLRFFSAYSGTDKTSLSYSQAARWLLYLNAYDDTSSKVSDEGNEKAGGKLPSMTVGWLGSLGLIYLKGNNLFETLMMNLVMINCGKVQAQQKPVWEKDIVSREERIEIAMPDNLAQLYTLQSRRILLIRENGEVTGYRNLGGEFFQKENAFFEPMTVWRTSKRKSEEYIPKRHDSSKQMWREFSVLFNEQGNHRAGVVEWYRSYIYGMEIVDEEYLLKTVIVSVEYGKSNSSVKNFFSDSLTMHSSLLSEVGNDWRNVIEHEIEKCDELASAVAFFSQNLYIASGGDPGGKEISNVRDTARSQLFYRLDLPFRQWLKSINPVECENTQDVIDKWRETAKNIAANYVEELAANAPESAIVGHYVQGKDKDKSQLYSSPKAKNQFFAKVKKIYS